MFSVRIKTYDKNNYVTKIVNNCKRGIVINNFCIIFSVKKMLSFLLLF